MSERFTRRDFLKSLGAAAGAIGVPYFVPSAAMGKAGAVSASNRITMGVIGCGAMGTGDMKAFLEREDVRVVAVCDVDSNHRNDAAKIVNKKYGNKDCAKYNDFRELLARRDIDAVCCALPDHWHAVVAVAALKTGKDVYGEKPLAHNIAEGRAIVDAVSKYGRIWQTGSQQRSKSDFRIACELVRNGRIGEVKTVKVGLPSGNKEPVFYKPEPVPEGFDYDMWLGPAPWAPYTGERCHWNFRWQWDYAGGQISDWAGHNCDIAQWGMGTDLTGPTEVEGSGIAFREGMYDTFNNYKFTCRYKQGWQMIVADTTQHKRGVRFEGSEGWIFVSRGGLSASSQSILASGIGANDVRLYYSDNHHGNFIDCVKSRRQTIAPAEVAQRSITIGHLGNIAMRLGRKIKWDPAKEQIIGDAEASKLLSRPMRGNWSLA